MPAINIGAHRLFGSVGTVVLTIRRALGGIIAAVASIGEQRADAAVVRRAAEAHVALPAKLTAERQWAAATTVVGTSLSRAEAAGRSHDAARMQVEAARYALDELMQDLGGVMRIEPVEAARRDAARVATVEQALAADVAERPIAA